MLGRMQPPEISKAAHRSAESASSIALSEARLVNLATGALVLIAGLACLGLLLSELIDGKLDGTALITAPAGLAMTVFGGIILDAGLRPPVQVVFTPGGINDLRTRRGVVPWRSITRATVRRMYMERPVVVFDTTGPEGAGELHVNIVTLHDGIRLTLQAIERFAPHVAHAGFLKEPTRRQANEKVDIAKGGT